MNLWEIFTNKQKLSNNGFTLIELLVTISIMLMITGGGIAAFVNFNDKQNVQVAARDLQTMLRAAQVKAKTGEGAGDCDLNPTADPVFALRGFKVKNNGNTGVVMQKVCAEKNPTGFFTAGTKDFIERDTKTFASGVTITDFDLEFLPLTGGVTVTDGVTTTSETITITGTGDHIFSFDVTSDGEITIGDFE